MTTPSEIKTEGGLTILHADHGVSAEHMKLIEAIAAASGDGFFIQVVDLPEGVPDLECALWGPSCGDSPIPEAAVTYRRRGSRRGVSRVFIGSVGRFSRPCRKMVVVGDAGSRVVYTAYGTLADAPTPREWWDTYLDSLAAVKESLSFWEQHALVWEGE